MGDTLHPDPLDVHRHDRPDGAARLASMGAVGGERRAETVVLDRCALPVSGMTVELLALHAGWLPAGSMLRWDDGAYAIRVEIDGSSHLRRWHSYPEARAVWSRMIEDEAARAVTVPA